MISALNLIINSSLKDLVRSLFASNWFGTQRELVKRLRLSCTRVRLGRAQGEWMAIQCPPPRRRLANGDQKRQCVLLSGNSHASVCPAWALPTPLRYGVPRENARLILQNLLRVGLSAIQRVRFERT